MSAHALRPDYPQVLADSEVFEPAFACSERSLALDRRYARTTLRHLGQCIARHPADLYTHTQRVLLAAAAEESEQLFSAMLDLAVALNGKGVALRRTLLERCGRVLSDAQRQAISAILDRPDVTRTASAPFRVLADRTIGAVVRAKKLPGPSASSSASPVSEALEFIENGQIEAAQAVLENAVAQGIDDIAASSLLLDIYRRSRNAAGFRHMSSRLSETSAEARLLWDTAHEWFEG